MKMIPMLAAILAAAAVPTVALAQSAPTRNVAYADLDLRSPAGIAALDARIAGAVRRVCEPRARPGVAGVGEWTDHRNCLRTTRAAARAQTRVVIARANRDEQLASR